MVPSLAAGGVAGVQRDEMNNEEFRRYGHQVVDWMADYLENIRDYPVLPAMQPGDLMDRLPASAPEHGESMDTILEDFRRSLDYFKSHPLSKPMTADEGAAHDHHARPKHAVSIG